jgi:predicted ATPase
MKEGFALLKMGVQGWQVQGFTHFTPFLLALQAKATWQMQKLNGAKDAVRTALEIGQCSGDRYWMAELYRLQGELLWAGGTDSMRVEACFNQAIATARQQGARMLELRAATSLARLWQQQGQLQAAQQVLAEVHDGFTEGLDSCDLTAASALLQELS